MFVSAIALVCSIALAPQDCDRRSAAAVITLPDRACGIGGQGVVADSAVKPGSGFYLMIICEGR